MARSKANAEQRSPPATRADIVAVFGSIDDGRVAAIFSLKPTIRDLEEASVWLAGDADVFGPGRPLQGVAAEIVTLLTAEDEEEA